MPLLSWFKTQAPRWEDPDPLARAEAVRQIPHTEQAILLGLVRGDADARVRRAALAKIGDVAVIAEVARVDADQATREEASERLFHLALDTADLGVGETAAATLSEPRHFVSLARSARLAAVRRGAVPRLKDDHARSSVAKAAEDPEIRRAALAAVTEPAALLEVALRAEHKDAALQAVDRLEDAAALALVAARARQKAAARRAQARLLERRPAEAGEPPAPRAPEGPDEDPAERARREDRDVREALVRALGDLGAEEVAERLPRLRREWQALPALPEEEGRSWQARFAEAEATAEARQAAWRAQAERRASLLPMVESAVTLAQDPDLAAAREKLAALRTQWEERRAEAPAELRDRFEAAGRALEERALRGQEEGRTRARENLERLRALAARLEDLARLEKPALTAVAQAMKDARAALDDPGPLPGRHDRETLLLRIRAARTALYPRAQELREADEWTRFANVAAQEALIEKAEALLARTDLSVVAGELRKLQARWTDVRHAPKERAEALWLRFKAATDELHRRAGEHFARRKEEQEEHRRAKGALVERAEALADSTDWAKTAAEMQHLQEEWRKLGRAEPRWERRLGSRFHDACHRFFERRKTDLAHRKEEWATNLDQKKALVARAEELSASSDWDRLLPEVKALQAEWKTIGPVRRSESDAVWQAFRAACDRVFERHKSRDQVTLQAHLAERELVLQELEAAGAGEEGPPADLGLRVVEIQSRWRHLPELPRDATEALEARFRQARDRWVSEHPDRFAGTDLDPLQGRHRMEKLVARVEALVVPAADSPAEDLAARLREALASNTMGGRAAAEARERAAHEELLAARAAWRRLGPVPGEEAAALARRFEEACRRVEAQARKRRQ